MRFPDVSNLGIATIEGVGRFVLLMVREDFTPDTNDEHQSEHARGQCECPCAWPDPLGDLLSIASEPER